MGKRKHNIEDDEDEVDEVGGRREAAGEHADKRVELDDAGLAGDAGDGGDVLLHGSIPW